MPAPILPPALVHIPDQTDPTFASSLHARDATLQHLRDLGPPDFCHLTKTHKTDKTIEKGGGHFVIHGVRDAGVVAAYVTGMFDKMQGVQGWFSSKQPFIIKSGLYCSYNAFSRIDTRVEINVPGGVSTYGIQADGKRIDLTDEHWSETYVCSILRALLDDNHYSFETRPNQVQTIRSGHTEWGTYHGIPIRRLDPFPDLKEEKSFLQECSKLFFRAHLLGCEADIHTASNVNNHMIAGLLKHFNSTHRYQEWVAFLKPLCMKDRGISGLLANAYIGMDKELDAVKVLHDALMDKSQAWEVLMSQATFLKQKRRIELAIQVSKLAVSFAPSEFVAWRNLVEVYIAGARYDLALLTLNSAPMFAITDTELVQMSEEAVQNIPIREDDPASPLPSGIIRALALGPQNMPTEPILERLQAPSLKGTFKSAYDLLCLIVSKMGWEETLAERTNVFVMEDEYQAIEADTESEADDKPLSSQSQANLAVPPPNKTPPATTKLPSLEVVAKNKVAVVEEDIGTLKNFAEDADEKDRSTQIEPVLDPPSSADAAAAEERKILEAAREEARATVDTSQPQATAVIRPDTKSLERKRLCERWLDNLFMIAYEDLRAFSMWQSEMKSVQEKNIEYRRSALEWELLGDLSVRLYSTENAKFAYQASADEHFSPRTWLKLIHYCSLDMEQYPKDLEPTLIGATHLIIWADRHYSEGLIPSPVATVMFRLVRLFGWTRVENTLKANINNNKRVEAWMKRFSDIGKTLVPNGLIGFDEAS